MALLYNIFIRCYVLAIRVAGLWNGKAAEWTSGRKDLFEKLGKSIAPSDRVIWFHCASAGELEQGKPLIEAVKERYPQHRIVISFFSPSGFGVGKKYAAADVTTYLPADTPANAGRFLDLVHPELVVFVKYEFWYHHLAAAASRQIPLLLASAIFRKEQLFFKPYGGLHRKMLHCFTRLFVQDEASAQLLRAHGFDHSSVSGDTRFDRVVRIAGQQSTLPVISAFARSTSLLVAGSTWPGDEKLLAALHASNLKLVIAPHEIDEAHIESILQRFPGALRYSAVAPLVKEDPSDTKTDLEERLRSARVLLIDSIGLLSRLYRYAAITYIGGGYNKSGIHNTLEAAVYGKPVLFGPNFQKFREARELVACGGACSVSTPAALAGKVDAWLQDPAALEAAGKAAGDYVAGHVGATERIMRYVQENRFLTS